MISCSIFQRFNELKHFLSLDQIFNVLVECIKALRSTYMYTKKGEVCNFVLFWFLMMINLFNFVVLLPGNNNSNFENDCFLDKYVLVDGASIKLRKKTWWVFPRVISLWWIYFLLKASNVSKRQKLYQTLIEISLLFFNERWEISHSWSVPSIDLWNDKYFFYL